jgi:phenylacetate-CoA ligase
MAKQDRPERFLDRQTETMPWPERLERLQQRVVANVRLAARRSRAYGDMFARAGLDAEEMWDLADLERLPLLRMSDLVRRQEEDPPFGGLETVSIEQFERIYVNPGFIWQPWEAGFQDASWAEAQCAGGIQAGDRVINTFPYNLWLYAHVMDRSARMAGAAVIPTGGGNAFMQVRILRKLAVQAYLGTPSFLMTLASRAAAMGLNPARDLSLRAAVVGAEMLPESLRAKLEQTLDISVRQAYGTVYLGCLGYECREKGGLHVPEGVWVEVVDPQTGRDLAPGQVGEVVATNLNPAYPMIRLATGDLSLWASGECACGRSSPRLQRIVGRLDQAVKVRGTFVHPWQLDEVLGARPEVFKYQAAVSRQQDKDRLAIQIELKEGVDIGEDLRRDLEQQIRDMLNVRGEVELVPQGSIPDFHGKIVDRRKWD